MLWFDLKRAVSVDRLTKDADCLDRALIPKIQAFVSPMFCFARAGLRSSQMAWPCLCRNEISSPMVQNYVLQDSTPVLLRSLKNICPWACRKKLSNGSVCSIRSSRETFMKLDSALCSPRWRINDSRDQLVMHFRRHSAG